MNLKSKLKLGGSIFAGIMSMTAIGVGIWMMVDSAQLTDGPNPCQQHFQQYQSELDRYGDKLISLHQKYNIHP